MIERPKESPAAEGAWALSRGQLEPVLRAARASWHYVNNPLFAIEGTVQLLLAAGCGENETYRAHLDRIQRACERIRATMQELREVTLPVLRALEGESAPVELCDHLPPVSYET